MYIVVRLHERHDASLPYICILTTHALHLMECTTLMPYRAAVRSALSGAGTLQEEVDQRKYKQAQAQAQTAFETLGDPGLHADGCCVASTWLGAGALVTATECACSLTAV